MENKHINTVLLLEAASSGNETEVQRLIPISEPKKQKSLALQQAAKNGHIECVKRLVAESDVDKSNALQWAAHNGHVDCLNVLIPLSTKKTKNNIALSWAAKNGHVECVKLLLPTCDPKANSSEALYRACQHNQPKCVDILLEHCDYDETLSGLKQYGKPSSWSYLEQKIIEQQHKRITDAIGQNGQSHTNHIRKI